MRKLESVCDESSAWWMSRAAAAGGFAFVALLTIVCYASSGLSAVAHQLLTDGMFLILWLLGAAGIGDLILRAARTELPRSLHLSVSFGLGIGVFSILTLLLGLAGWLNHWSAAGFVAAPAIYAILRICRARRDVSGWLSERTSWGWLLLLLAPLLGMALVAALVPPGILWGDEPHGYDVVEYHLQLPRQWLEVGRIVPLTHNVFSYFPLNVEMNYLLAMQLRGGPWAGMYLAQLMHVAFIALTVFTIYALLAERGAIAVVACVFAGAVPWMSLLAPVAYNEGGLLLWGTLAIGLALRSCNALRNGDAASFVIAGAFAGLASGAKLTGVPMILLAVPVAMVLAKPRAAEFRKVLLSCAVFVVAGLATFSPWLIRDFAWTGNPVFPESTAIFGKAHWSDAQVQRWRRANHLPNPKIASAADRFKEGWYQIVGDARYSYLVIELALIAAILAWSSLSARALILLLGMQAILWLFFTHLQSRFFILSIPIAALLIGRVRRPGWTPALAAICVLVGVFTWFSISQRITKFTQPGVLGAQDVIALTPLADVKLPKDARVVLVGDARAFWYQIPTDRLSYRTVFDVNARPGESSVDAWREGAPSGANVLTLIDPGELRRFSAPGSGYWMIPPPPPEVAGHDRPYIER